MCSKGFMYEDISMQFWRDSFTYDSGNRHQFLFSRKMIKIAMFWACFKVQIHNLTSVHVASFLAILLDLTYSLVNVHVNVLSIYARNFPPCDYIRTTTIIMKLTKLNYPGFTVKRNRLLQKHTETQLDLVVVHS